MYRFSSHDSSQSATMYIALSYDGPIIPIPFGLQEMRCESFVDTVQIGNIMPVERRCYPIQRFRPSS